MSDAQRLSYLRIVLLVVAAGFILGFYPLTILWPSGWTWGHGHSHYLMMIVGLYATLGVFLILAARDPEQHLSLIRFTIWSSLVHAAIMAVQSLSDPDEMGHMIADIPMLCLVAIALAVLMPRRRLS